MKKRFLCMALAACGGAASEPSGQPVEDLELLAFVDDDGDGLSFDDAPRAVRLSDYFARSRPGTRLIVLNAAAGWCSPCQAEAAALSEFAATYEPAGVVVLTAVIQDHDGAAATSEFARLWAETFSLSVPVLVDEDFATAAYFDLSAMPANLFIDAETETVLRVAVGADSGDDPMREYRDLVDHYLEEEL